MPKFCIRLSSIECLKIGRLFFQNTFKMKIAIRVDASSRIGTGHFMRCLTLADALKQSGAQVRFISRHLPEHLRSMLAEHGHEFVSFNGPKSKGVVDDLAHANWLGVSQSQDAADSIQVLSDRTWDWLIVDHYALDARWESALRRTAKQIMAIDDIADRQHDCDMLLDLNYYSDMSARYSDKVPSHCQLLLGPRYALLRDEFRQLREQVQPRTGIVKRILVFFGGIDADNHTGSVIKVLAVLGVKELHVDVVIGVRHPCREQIEAECVQHGFICHVQTVKMAELMAAADLAIGAGGTATWERIYLGLPALVKVVSTNQEEALSHLADSGYVEIWRDSHQLKSLITARLISNIPLPPIDIRSGSHEVVKKVFLDCQLISFNAKHIRRTYKWLLSQQLRDEFLLTSVPTVKQHCHYWRAVLVDPSQKVFAIQLYGRHVGSCGLKYIDQKEGCAEIWIYLGDIAVRGMSVGTSAMKLLEKEAAKIISNGRLVLHVGKSNTVAIKLYLKSGYAFSNAHAGQDWGEKIAEVCRMEKVL